MEDPEVFCAILVCAVFVLESMHIVENFPVFVKQAGKGGFFMTDPIASMLTSIRNAQMKLQEKVDIPASNIKENMLKIMRDEGFIANYKRIDNGNQGVLRAYLKYTPKRKQVITGMRRVSKPGLRIYRDASSIPNVRGGLGIVLLSTSKGIMVGYEAKRQKIGGEVLCYLW